MERGLPASQATAALHLITWKLISKLLVLKHYKRDGVVIILHLKWRLCKPMLWYSTLKHTFVVLQFIAKYVQHVANLYLHAIRYRCWRWKAVESNNEEIRWTCFWSFMHVHGHTAEYRKQGQLETGQSSTKDLCIFGFALGFALLSVTTAATYSATFFGWTAFGARVFP